MSTKSFTIQMRFICQLSILSSLLGLFSCEKEVTNIKLPSTKPKLVVGCFLSPQDTLIRLSLTRSKPIFGTEPAKKEAISVTDALVIISNKSQSITLSFNAITNKYEVKAGSFPIVAGTTYSLKISTPNGEIVSATCTIPDSPIPDARIELLDTSSATKVVNIKWKDIPNETNYYTVIGQAQQIVNGPIAQDTLLTSLLYDGTSSLNDNRKDGNELSMILIDFNPGSEHIISTHYSVWVLNIDLNYYQYEKSSFNYTGDDPFSEPSPVYTNIKDGLGIFAGYQQKFIKR
jgi:hypothetical protein